MENSKPEAASGDSEQTRKLKDEYNEDAIIQVNWQEKIDDIKAVFKSLTEAKELKENWSEMSQQCERAIISLETNFSGNNTNKFIPTRLVNIKEMARSIERWFNKLTCDYPNCTAKANNFNDCENDINFCCVQHSYLDLFMNGEICFVDNDLLKIKNSLFSLENLLILVQKEMACINDQTEQRDATYQHVISYVNENYQILTKLLGNIRETVDLLTESSGEIDYKEKNEKYKTLSYMENDCNECVNICKEILSKASNLDLDKKIKSLITEMIIQNKYNDFKEEFKYDEDFKFQEEDKNKEYHEFPEELYDKEYEIDRKTYQTKLVLKKMKSWINELLKKIETTELNTNQLSASIGKIDYILRYKLADYERSLNRIKQKQRQIMNEINKKEGLIKRDEQFEQLKKHLLITNQNLKKKNIPEKEKIQIIVNELAFKDQQFYINQIDDLKIAKYFSKNKKESQLSNKEQKDEMIVILQVN